jgi:hypothetical protein
MLPLVAQSVKRYFCFRVAASSNKRGREGLAYHAATLCSRLSPHRGSERLLVVRIQGAQGQW